MQPIIILYGYCYRLRYDLKKFLTFINKKRL